MNSLKSKASNGIVLVTCLVILLILTMLALSSVQSSSLQELITRNQRDSNLAFNAAEAAIVVAEARIAALTDISYDVDASPLIYDRSPWGRLTCQPQIYGLAPPVFALRGMRPAQFKASARNRGM